MGRKAILIDDEPLSLQYLQRQIQKVSDLSIVAAFTYFDPETQFAMLQAADVVFLDIEMPEINGLELAEQIVEANPDVMIVFVTAYDEYAVEAFELNVLDYIVKPVQLERLQTTIARLEARFVSDDNDQIAASQTKQDSLRINLCGETRLSSEPDKTHQLRWRTAKAEELFLFLLLRANETVQKSVLVDWLWPDIVPERAYAHLYTAVYHLRKALSSYQDYIHIQNKHGGYILLTDNVVIDVIEWETTMKALPSIQPETIDDYENCMAIVGGRFFGAHDYIWAEAARHRLEQKWLKYAYRIAEFYEANSEFEQAQSWYMQICNMVPEEEQAAFALMKLYARYGYHVLVSHQYHALQDALDTIDIAVNPDITDWFTQWKTSREYN